jgi:hypothetical protein
MNSQKYNKDELYPEDFSEDEKPQFDMYLEQSKMLFPKLANDEWLIKNGIFAYMRKEKIGDTEPPSLEDMATIKINIPMTLYNTLNLLKKRLIMKL